MSQPPAFALPDGLSLHLGWKAGLIGWIVRQHGLYYAQNWQLGSQFEAIVAQALGEFMLRYDPSTDRLISLYKGGEPVASLTLDGGHERVAEDGARIRFVIIDPNWHSGLGWGLNVRSHAIFARDSHAQGLFDDVQGFGGSQKAL